MRRICTYSFLWLGLFAGTPAAAQSVRYTDVLVVGGGAGGTAAGLQCARMGVATVIAEPTVWLGGMLSAAGVAAFDGNHNLPAGIWNELREKIYAVYGGAGKVATGWVSNTLFEPHVGDSLLKTMVAATPGLTVLYRHQLKRVLRNGKKLTGAVFTSLADGKTVTIYASQVIDATELGDVMANAGVPFSLGMEASSSTGENVQVPATNNIVQDITYAAILKDAGPAADCTIVKPAAFDPMEFDGCCTDYYHDKSRIAPNVDAKKMLDYGKLPNGKYMLNWPGYGNDIYLNVAEMTEADRHKELEKAKQQTLRFVYFIQAVLGFKHLALARDEFPTTDGLPLIPYHRESRRVKGLVRMKIQHIATPFETEPLYRTGIAVGDYPIDHHHRKNPAAPQHLGFYPVPSFNVPLGALIPKSVDGLVVAEKGISVSNVVNGTTRLQPCVLLIGQAAGMLAALSVKNKQQPRQIPVRAVQAQLLAAGAYLLPYFDVKPADKHFESIQRIGATGILRGTGIPKNWANQTWFYPDSLVNAVAFERDFFPFYKRADYVKRPHLLLGDALAAISGAARKSGLAAMSEKAAMALAKEKWADWGLLNFNVQRPLNRRELAVLLDKTVNPFKLKTIDHEGRYKN